MDKAVNSKGNGPTDEWAGPSLLPRVLVLLSPSLQLQPLRMAARMSGTSMLFEGCRTAEDLEARLADGPQAALCLASEPQILQIASAGRLAGVAVFAVVRDGMAPGENFASARPLLSGVLREDQFRWLPLYLERARRPQDESPHAAHVERRLQEAAQSMGAMQKLAAMGRMAGTIAHEINNPLESVTNLLYLVSSDPALPDHLRDYMKMAEQELGRVGQISKQTLNFYRETKTPVRMDIQALLDEVIVLFGRRLKERGISVQCENRAGEEAGGMTLFPGEMRQVFANLVGNAIEASNKGARLRLRVRASRRWNDAGVLGLRITIADTGSGIPENVRAQLGSPFFTTKGQRGTGLGLWVSQGIVKRNGGNIRVRSSTTPKHHGTVFTIFLPTNLRPRAIPA